jgi:AcrR family transcriptional regulator
MMPRRERLRQAAIDEIKAAAWAQVDKLGSAGLSLRGVAAALGMTAPAIYRYFPSKAHLVTALIMDAFASLAADQCRRAAASEGLPWDERLRDLGRGYREWALARPAAFFLIFGSPVPGYEPPWAQTMPVAATSLDALRGILLAAQDAGELCLPLDPPPAPGLARSLAEWSGAFHHVDPDVLYVAFTVAARVQGLVLVELGRQLPPFFVDGRELYERELERIVRELRS